MSVASINTKVGEAVTAWEAGDVDTAITKLTSAAMLMDGLPDSERQGASLTWNREGIDRMLTRLNKIKAANTGIQRQQMRFDLYGGTCDD